jgi:hypothetical protein
MTPSWPSAVLLSVVTLCVSALVWKGAIPSHALFAILGAVVGWVTSRAVPVASSLLGARSALVLAPSEEGFSKEEIPTKPELTTAAGTVIMKVVKKEDLEKR